MLLLVGLMLASFPSRAEIDVEEIAVLEDISGTKDIHDILALPDSAFIRQLHGLSAGYTRSAHWVRFRLKAPSGESGTWWLEVMPPFLDDIRLYEPDPTDPDRILERRAGDLLPFTSREAPYRGFLFRLTLDDQQERTLYLRIENSRTSLAILTLWKPDQFAAAVLFEYILLGSMLGLMAALLIINFIFWRSQRDPVLLAYIFYVAAVLLSTLTTQGLALQFLFPEHPSHVNLLQKITTLIMVSAAGVLYQRVLQVSRSEPWLYWLYWIYIATPIPLLLAIPLGYFTEALDLVMKFSLLMVVVGLTRGILLMRRGIPGGTLVVGALIASLLSLFAGLIQLLGWIQGHFLILHAVMIGLLFTVISLHIALAVRIRVERQQHSAAVQQLKESEAKAKQERLAREEQAHFISMLAHELRTPVAGIAAAADSIEILLAKDTAEVSTRINRIRRAVRRISGVADRYLQMDRTEHAHQTPNISVHTVRAIIDFTLHQFSDTDMRLRCGPIADAHINCDRDLLATALINLIDNALKYSPLSAPVVLSAKYEHGMIAIHVDDYGKGIPESLRDKIFERYVRAPEHGNVPGIGVGLALVRRIVEIHKGSVTVSERAAAGTRFTILLNATNPTT